MDIGFLAGLAAAFSGDTPSRRPFKRIEWDIMTSVEKRWLTEKEKERRKRAKRKRSGRKRRKGY